MNSSACKKMIAELFAALLERVPPLEAQGWARESNERTGFDRSGSHLNRYCDWVQWQEGGTGFSLDDDEDRSGQKVAQIFTHMSLPGEIQITQEFDNEGKVQHLHFHLNNIPHCVEKHTDEIDPSALPTVQKANVGYAESPKDSIKQTPKPEGYGEWA